MKILCVVDGWFPSAGGSEKQAILIAENMRDRGHSVEYLSPQLDANAAKLEDLNGIPCKRLGFLRVPGLASATYCLNAARFLVQYGHRYDVIHIHMVAKFAMVLACIKPFVRVTVLAKVAGATEFDNGVFDTRLNGIISRVLRQLTLRIGVFQAISRQTVARLDALGLPRERMLVLPNAIDLSRFTPSRALHAEADTAPTVLAFTGRLVEEKSLPVLIAAIALLKTRTDTPFELRLAGDGPLRSELELLVATHGLEKDVTFYGEIDNVDAFLAAAHVYCQVSRIEGLSNSVLEAMASGLPCVLTRISGNEDLLVDGENGLGVEVGDAEGLADQLATLVEDRALCRRMGMAARSHVEGAFGVERVTAAIERCYRGETVFQAVGAQ